ncbi:MAG TPA: SPOR domain-containing protein [Vitreimonas sp.]|uniref:SPOR domain-containing protein n=1 Tax=Vitreimonas sp. TaxID=3069702 RepID=UPI002D6AB31C|nr:SPOR domain-containing protein [Vitreimonas sp.]HYD86830.1 SPOR domain-containing protein [Vitreimonas sp.]
MSTRYDPRMHAYDDHQTRHAGFVYGLMIIIAVAFGAFLWQLYSAPEIPRIPAPSGPYKVEPPSGAANAPDATESAAYAAPTEEAAPSLPTTRAEADEPAVEGPPQLPTAPRFVGNGPYVAQLAALQSEAAVDQAWRRLSSRAPQLFASARLDIERADLGARGVYYRVRAGYFADRDNAARFCDRIRQMGQDCIVAAR